VGCSYLHNIDQLQINTDKFEIRATPGSGNQSMAARVIYECSQRQFDQVVVVWSGINRLDFPIGKELHKVQSKNKLGEYDYGYFTEIGDMAWYHSGGWGLSGCSYPCPTFLQYFFKNQYVGSTNRYLSDMSLLAIIQVQSFLAHRAIPYKMSFIYDIHNDHIEPQFAPGLGNLDKASPLNTQVDWTKFSMDLPMFEYAQDTEQLSKDKFHPTSDCMIEWFKTYMDIDLTA